MTTLLQHAKDLAELGYLGVLLIFVASVRWFLGYLQRVVDGINGKWLGLFQQQSETWRDQIERQDQRAASSHARLAQSIDNLGDWIQRLVTGDRQSPRD